MFAPEVEVRGGVDDGLNDAQRDAVLHDGGPLVVVAGAGTGKTRTLAARVARLLRTGTPPERILLLTFSRRAAREMLGRAALLAGTPDARRVWGGTFHAMANRLLRTAGAAAGVDPAFTILDQSDVADLLGLVRTDLGLGGNKRFPRNDTLAAIHSRTVNAQVRLGDAVARWYPWCTPHVDDIREVFRAFRERKRTHHVLDFDDLLLFLRAVATDPATAAAVRDRFDHVLVDELQDTNRLQADIVAALCPDGGGFFGVGDAAQAIYGFRSAAADAMDDIVARFPATRIVRLEENHRSTPEVLAVANAVIAESPSPLTPRLRSTRPAGPVPRLTVCADESAEAALVCDRVLAARDRGLDLRQQAVLVRAAHHSAALELELARRGIPFVKYGGLRFLEAAHVKDLLALLRILDNDRDEVAWQRVLMLADGVGPATARRIVAALGAQPAAAFVAAAPVPAPRAAAADLDDLRAALAGCAGVDPPPVATQIERLAGFLVPRLARRFPDAAVRAGDLEALAALASSSPTRQRFLADLTLDPPAATTDLAREPHLDDDYLVLSTIHSAKGGEWNVVHVVHAADGNIPSDMALSDREGLEEERRLLYVALTRARDELYVTYPQRFYVRRFGTDDRHVYAQPSRFLAPAASALQRDSAPGLVAGRADDPAAVDVSRSRRAAAAVDALLDDLWG